MTPEITSSTNIAGVTTAAGASIERQLSDERQALLNFCLHRGDACLILGQRLGAWCGHGPVLEQDIALTNIALDLVGQARSYYQYAADLEGQGRTEDDFAYLRNDGEFLNPLLCEVENGDWGQTILRQFFFDAHHFALLTKLAESSDEHLRAIAAKSIKEVAYHRRYSSEWVVRLGDGTTESQQRMQRALDGLWKFTGELVSSAPVDVEAAKFSIAPAPENLANAYWAYVSEVLAKADLHAPELPLDAMRQGGKSGKHSEKLGFLLAEMQHLHRSHPGAKW